MAGRFRNPFRREEKPEQEQAPQAARARETGNPAAMPPRGMAGRPVNPAAGTAGQRGIVPGRAGTRPTGQDNLPAARQAVRSGEANEAYGQGERMGAENQMRLAGREPFRTGGGTETGRQGLTRERLEKATRTLLEYKRGKNSVDRRVIRAQEWWRLRNWEQIQEERGTKGATRKKSSTAWLWNCLVGKHADAIDSFPEPIILPRMADDKEEAERLSEIIPVVLTMNDFEDTYNKAQWQKLQEGTAVYGVFWDKTKMGGMGDIAVRKINILNLFWEPGVTDIQDSRNVFFVYLQDKEELEGRYPQLRGKLKGENIITAKYRTDDHIPTEGKAAVVDWYYHTYDQGRETLQLCTYCGEEVLYSTEQEGIALYDDGRYPFVLDPLFPVEGSPAGYGYIDIGKDAQADIDTLNQAMVLNATASATPRHFIRKDGGVNEEEFADWAKPLVHVNGNMGEDSIRAIQTVNMGGNCMNMLQQKIDELKFVTGNTDINNGGVPSGVTAASAIAALKEDSGRSSKDSTKSAYRAYRKIVDMVIERIRQFYDIQRQFRILDQEGKEKYIAYSNEKLKAQQMQGGLGLETTMRLPVFDIDVQAQRESAYTKMTQNELAIQFLQLGVFSPNLTDQALMALDMMDFKGKDEIRRKIEQNGTMAETMQKVGQIALALAQKYEPQMAQQLAGVLQGIQGQGGALASNIEAGGSVEGVTQAQDAMANQEAAGQQNAIVRRARERAANATRPS